MKKLFYVYLLLLPHWMLAQSLRPWSQRLAATVMATYPDSPAHQDGQATYWNYEMGLVLHELLRQNDLKGVGPFIHASIEMELMNEPLPGKNKTVAVDTYFNHEFRKGMDRIDGPGPLEPFHYTWEDRTHSGFWLWGNTFRDLGAKTVSVPTAPTAASLKPVDVYIIVDPDTPRETAKPNYVNQTDIQAISDWVKAGGVLVLMANDTANCEHFHFNQLAARFGLQFLPKNVNMVKNDQFEQGSVAIPAGNDIFPHTRTVFIKDLSPLGVKAPAEAVVTKQSDIIMAVAKWGRGTVFAVGDPWLYNEYTDGRTIPVVYENFKAGKELAIWLLKQVGTPSSVTPSTGK